VQDIGGELPVGAVDGEGAVESSDSSDVGVDEPPDQPAEPALGGDLEGPPVVALRIGPAALRSEGGDAFTTLLGGDRAHHDEDDDDDEEEAEEGDQQTRFHSGV